MLIENALVENALIENALIENALGSRTVEYEVRMGSIIRLRELVLQ